MFTNNKRKIILGITIFLNIIVILYLFVISEGLKPTLFFKLIAYFVPILNMAVLAMELIMQNGNNSLDSERLTVFANLMRQIDMSMSTLDNFDKMLLNINKTIINILKVDYSSMFLYDDEQGTFKRLSTNLRDPNLFAELQQDLNTTLHSQIAEKEEEVYIRNCRYNSAEQRGVKTAISIPIKIHGQTIGIVLAEFKRIYKLDNNSKQILRIIGGQIGNILISSNANRKMEFMAKMDNLTKVYNRHSIQNKLNEEYKKAQNLKSDLSLIIFDIDNFKKCNDTYGHLFGDKVLSKVAKCVKNNIRALDTIGRYGGEEFIVLFPSTSLENAYNVANKIRNKISELELESDQGIVNVTASFGLAHISQSTDEKDLIDKADIALYVAKRTGKNKVVVYTDELADTKIEKNNIL